ncbi:hypothetical protein QKG08_14855 [Clavibacter michiganensis]|uniref:hypothetical protein n=1 Tax=Clavibacter michiganensis TaxID=28447 RepID=UPI0026DB3C3C|nr:hypothetical protein [Clavibacter michiganensis]MDO4070331.1 hypothetical protein [Clavibacter michiganensis]
MKAKRPADRPFPHFGRDGWLALILLAGVLVLIVIAMKINSPNLLGAATPFAAVAFSITTAGGGWELAVATILALLGVAIAITSVVKGDSHEVTIAIGLVALVSLVFDALAIRNSPVPNRDE